MHDIQIPWQFYDLVNVINYSNSFANPVVYALRIPEFREALVLCCLRRAAAPNMVNTNTRSKNSFTNRQQSHTAHVQTRSSGYQILETLN